MAVAAGALPTVIQPVIPPAMVAAARDGTSIPTQQPVAPARLIMVIAAMVAAAVAAVAVADMVVTAADMAAGAGPAGSIKASTAQHFCRTAVSGLTMHSWGGITKIV